MIDSTEKLKDFITNILNEKKVEKINVMELSEEIGVAKYMIFATGRSIKNISSIASFIALELKHQLRHSSCLEGLNSGWVLLDAGDVIVHLFDAERREIMKLEDLWSARKK